MPENKPTNPPAPEPIFTESKWTQLGNRVAVGLYPDFLVLSAETQWSQKDGKRAVFVQGRVVVVQGAMLSNSMAFVRHAFDFYGDAELTEAAVATVDTFFKNRVEDTSVPRPANPNAN